MSDVGVVVVTYNSAEVIGTCLDNCSEMKTLVVDNHSMDNTAERVRERPWVRFVANPENRGFAAAVNQGVAQTSAEFILLLNPDLKLLNSVDPLMEECARPEVGMAAGLLVDAAGKPQRGFSVRRLPTPASLIFEVLGINRLFRNNPVNKRYRCLDLPLDGSLYVEQPAGAFLLFRKALWERLGGFDESFHPLWFEDVDFCRRTIDAGYRIRFIPKVIASHQGGHSVGKLEWSCRERYWYASLLRYASKHFHSNGFRGVSMAVVVGSMARAMVETARTRKSDAWRVYTGIIRLATECALRGQIPEEARGTR